MNENSNIAQILENCRRRKKNRYWSKKWKHNTTDWWDEHDKN